ncbi:tol-pal system protein YbgF [Massilia sp. BSC265]|uniref:tol-pal system protein YbgF n=1 Tax=Massilia sp. BSC265 TaxID=1549812 RepID=UPI0004E96918|nr:tol-pal system protein YbgF [Massilia sp. BSC265]KFI06790.1 Tol system periplasmic component YbgF [Massilia sp. BSC265]
MNEVRKPSFLRHAAAAFVLSACLPLQASGGLLDDEEARKAILALSAKVDSKLRDIDANMRELHARIDTKGDRIIGLDMLNQHEQTMRELASLRGQIEVLTNEIANARKNQKDLYADLDARIRKFESRQEAAETAPTEKKSYDTAMNALRAGDYKDAAGKLHAFLRLFPDSDYAADARYWLGNSYFAHGDYKKAIVAHEDMVARHADSASVPDAMLNIAASYSQLNDKKNATKSLRRVILTYAGSHAANIARERLAQLK